MTSPLTQDSDPGVVRSAPPLLQRQRHNLHLTESAGATQASRAHASDKYAFERTKLRTRRAHVNEVAALSMRNSHKRRGHTLRQTPHQFMEALERTKTLVDIIRQPTPFGAGPSDRLEHRLENLISEQEEEEEETESRKVKTLQLENKTFAVIHKIDGMHFYSIDIPRRGQPYALTVEVWSATDSNAVRLYVSSSEIPTPAAFDWWSPTNSRLAIEPDDPRFQFGMYWITVAAMGPNAGYKLVCSQRMRRPVFSTVHDKAAEELVKEGVMEHIKASEARLADSRNGSKPLRPSYREHFRPLPPPQAPATDHVDAPLLSRTTSEALMASFDRVRSGSRDGLALKKWISAPLPSSAPEGEDLEGMGADRRTSMTISRMQSSSNSTGRAGGGAGSELEHGISRKSSADYASSCSSNARQKPKPIKMMTKEEKERITLERCNYFEKKHLKTTLEPFSIHSRAVSVEDSPFNPQKLRQTLAHIHEVSSADNDNKKKYENSQVDAMDICSEFMSRSLRQSIESATRSTAHRLGGSAASDKQAHAPVPGSPAGALSEQHSHGHHKSRTQAQWAVTTEDPRLRSMIGREGLPRRMYMLRRDAIDYRTHSFAEGYFRLTRVGALEMTADEAGAHERNKDVSFVHLAQIQELISATEITLPDQPSTFHCFRLEFPSTKGNDKFYLTLAAFSPEERSKWLEALNLFTELTAAERERAAKRAAFKKQQKLNTKHHLMAQQLSLDKPDTATSPARPSSVGLAGAGGGPLPPRREGEALPAGATEGGDGGVGSAGRGGEGGGGRWFGEKEPAAGARQWTNGGMSQGAPGAASGPAAAAGAELPGAALKSPGVLTAVGGSFSLSGASDRVRPMSAVPWSTANASSPPTKYTKDAVRPTSALR